MIATILAGVNKDEVIQYILAMLDELLIGACRRAAPGSQ